IDLRLAVEITEMQPALVYRDAIDAQRKQILGDRNPLAFFAGLLSSFVFTVDNIDDRIEQFDLAHHGTIEQGAPQNRKFHSGSGEQGNRNCAGGLEEFDAIDAVGAMQDAKINSADLAVVFGGLIELGIDIPLQDLREKKPQYQQHQYDKCQRQQQFAMLPMP